MSVAPVPDRAALATGAGQSHDRVARWAVGLSLVSGATLAASFAAIAILYAVGEEGAVEDTWLGVLLALTAFAGLLGSVAAFVLAIVARIRRERWRLLWLPLCVFPAIALLLVLGEAFWWE